MAYEGSPTPERRNYRPNTIHTVQFEYPDARVIDVLSYNDTRARFRGYVSEVTGAAVEVNVDVNERGDEAAHLEFRFLTQPGDMPDLAPINVAAIAVYDWLEAQDLADAQLESARLASQEGDNDQRLFIPFTDHAQEVMESLRGAQAIDPRRFGPTV